ncbi:LysM peptidoglycan-binding domain-containing M23 family metallopeptidase [Bosea sp. (in: a-proteobacteria)]|uniref:LysM peptidoglycan-binding domain-containing M23 family metallopeptidase n=1 Tax=Bosea sp. (in: a-proteobacteria) TaxID=1871050 RepID=UPI002FCC65D3
MPKSLGRLVSVCALAAGLGACSEATRFTEAPFSNPFRTAQAPAARDPATTGSIGRSSPQQASANPYGSAPVAAAGGVRSQPLPPPASAAALRSAPVSAPVSAPSPAVVGSASGWSAQGGTPIVMAHGENLDTISGRYGVPRSALMSVNGLSGTEVTPGTRIVVPVYNVGGAQTASRQAMPSEGRSDANRLAPPPAARPAGNVLRPAGTAEAKAQAAAETRAKAAADAKAMSESRARFAAEAKAKAAARPVAEAKPSAPAVAAKPKAAPQVASLPPEQKPLAKPAPEPKTAPEPQTTASLPPKTEEPASGTDFRWPARGRVIAGYNGKGGNEGINIAVPEGTPVKAAEGGVVAYAGSELKGYGNLVLIRHPNGYVSAYAHNGELSVKRGEQVKRGQVVAKSGQSGNVNSPQLHFELRKGSTPVDPVPYLNN